MSEQPTALELIRRARAALLAADAAFLDQVAQHYGHVRRRLLTELELLAQQIMAARAAGASVSLSWLYQQARYHHLLVAVEQELRGLATWAEPAITTQQQALLEQASAAADAQLDRAPVMPARIPRAVFAGLVGLAGDGSPLRDLLLAAWPQAADALTQALLSGVALGHNPRRIARTMVEHVDAAAGDRLLLIARTEPLRVAREAMLARFRQRGITHYRRMATKSRRTCLACLLADGRVYPIETPFDEHPNGRCTPVAVIPGQALTWESGQTWLLRQPMAVQRQVVGPGRYAAWQAGTISLEDMVRRTEHVRWGGSLVATPLRDLI